MKIKRVVVPILIVIISVILIFTLQESQKETKSPVIPTTPATPKLPQKIQECPDAWYKNTMPIIIDDPKDAQHAGEYFMVNNERREISEYNVEWIVDNCEIKSPQPIN